MMSDRSRVRPSGVSRSLVNELMKFYDFPHPHHPKRIIRGYDRPHALRTARMCVAVANRLGHPRDRVQLYHVACLLHDLGRAGLDRQLFGTIWSWAKQRGIPTRPREWRAIHPRTTYGRETEAFVPSIVRILKRPACRWMRGLSNRSKCALVMLAVLPGDCGV